MKLSIVSLIYRSPTFADAVYDSLMRHTPLLRSGDVRFFFVANDATPEVLEHLKKKNYPYVVHENPKRTPEELFKMGYAKPEYIHRVYRAYNRAIMESDDMFVLINSDLMFSPRWLESLLGRANEKLMVCSQLVERWHKQFGVFPSAYRGEFGDHPSRFDEAGFLKLVQEKREPSIVDGGAYMPCLLFKKEAIVAVGEEGINT